MGGGGWVGEHQRRPRKLATGSFGREEGWRRDSAAALEGAAAMVAAAAVPRQQGQRSSALSLRKEREKGEDGSELAGML